MPRTLAAALVLLATTPRLARAQEAGAAAATPPASSASPAAPAAPEGPLATVRLRSGQVLTGRVVSRDERELVLLSADGVRSVIPAASVAEVREAEAGATRPPRELDPNRTRYLYSPSGFMLPQGEGYLSQTELFLTTFAYGVTDWLTVGAGGIVPAWFVSDGFNLTGFVKVGGSVTPWLHVAGTAQTFWLPGADDSTAAGLGFATVTFGGPDLHLGVSAGVPFVVGGEANELGDAAFSVSAVARVAERVALVTENWFFPTADQQIVVSGAAIRFIGSRLAVDTGFLFATDVEMPIPWLDFTWHF